MLYPPALVLDLGFLDVGVYAQPYPDADEQSAYSSDPQDGSAAPERAPIRGPYAPQGSSESPQTASDPAEA
jgi:hypothetical protein